MEIPGQFRVEINKHTPQRRTNIEITRAGEPGESANCLVSNMGAESFDILGVIAVSGQTYFAAATQRRKITQDELSDLREKKTEGPLETGKSRDIGSFKDLVTRIVHFRDVERLEEDIEEMKILFALNSGFHKQIAAAEQAFSVTPDGRGSFHVTGRNVSTRQLRGRRSRRRIHQSLNNVQQEEADLVRRTVQAAGPRENVRSVPSCRQSSDAP